MSRRLDDRPKRRSDVLSGGPDGKSVSATHMESYTPDCFGAIAGQMTGHPASKGDERCAKAAETRL